MAGFTCPFCNKVMVINSDTLYRVYPAFRDVNDNSPIDNPYDSTIELSFYCCPSCGQYSISAKGLGPKVKSIALPLQPNSKALQFPDYIPQPIRQDYEEACAIVNLSPKASATLSRRCLQGMIRDYWGICKKTLNAEISELQNKITPDLWCALDSLRQLGNIGAHMESDINTIVDIDPGEADNLIKLIELLMKEWYINREERNKLFGSILNTNATKQSERKGGAN